MLALQRQKKKRRRTNLSQVARRVLQEALKKSTKTPRTSVPQKPTGLGSVLQDSTSHEFRVLPIERTLNLGVTSLKEGLKQIENTPRKTQPKIPQKTRFDTGTLERLSQLGRSLLRTALSDRASKRSIQRLADQFEQSKRRTQNRQKPFVFQPFGLPSQPGPAEQPGIELPQPFIPYIGIPDTDEPSPTPIPRQPEPKIEEPRIPPDITCTQVQEMLRILGLPPIVCGQPGGGSFSIRGRL